MWETISINTVYNCSKYSTGSWGCIIDFNSIFSTVIHLIKLNENYHRKLPSNVAHSHTTWEEYAREPGAYIQEVWRRMPGKQKSLLNTRRPRKLKAPLMRTKLENRTSNPSNLHYLSSFFTFLATFTLKSSQNAAAFWTCAQQSSWSDDVPLKSAGEPLN